MNESAGKTRRQVLAGVATAVTLAATPPVVAAPGPGAAADAAPVRTSAIAPAHEAGPVERRRARITASYGLDVLGEDALSRADELLEPDRPSGPPPPAESPGPGDQAGAWRRLFATLDAIDAARRSGASSAGETQRARLGALKRSRDRQALALAKAGEPHAMELFHLWRAPDLLRLLGKPHPHAPDEAEDVAQTAWERFWAEAVGGDKTVADPFSYLVQIARNHAADLWRRHQGRRRDPGHLASLQDALGPDGGWRLEDVIGAEDERARLHRDCERLVEEARAEGGWSATYVEASIRRALGLPAPSLTEIASAHGLSKSHAYRLLETWRAEHAPRYLDGE